MTVVQMQRHSYPNSTIVLETKAHVSKRQKILLNSHLHQPDVRGGLNREGGLNIAFTLSR